MKITLLTGQTYDLENSFDFPLQVNVSTHSRRLTLRIDSKQHQAVLTMPRLCSRRKAYAFVEAHRDWVEENLARLPKVRDFTDGETISLLGQSVTICRLPDSNSAARLENNTLYVGGEAVFLHRRVKDYIKREAKKAFLTLSRAYAERIGCEVNDVFIKDTKSRWGSCSSLNNINYNWRIALAPSVVINYLMAHEVAHLRHHDHSPAFWHCVEALNPEAAEGRRWLKAHGNELYLYR